ncbi:MAG: ABC transporter permease, partial [Sphingobacterium sp.]
PSSFLLIKNWLNNFAYHIEISWWYFGLAGIIVFSIILFAISFQSIKAAMANPVDNLKEE